MVANARIHLGHRSMPASGRWWRLSPLLVFWLRLLPNAGKLRRGNLADPRRLLLQNTGALLKRFDEDFLMRSSLSRKVHGLIERAMRLRTA
jgi:hypothetical protein